MDEIVVRNSVLIKAPRKWRLFVGKDVRLLDRWCRAVKIKYTVNTE